MTVDISKSPCRDCTKQGQVKCRSKCKELAAYVIATQTYLPIFKTNWQYEELARR